MTQNESSIKPSAVAQAIAVRLRNVAPAGIEIVASGSKVRVFSRGGQWSEIDCEAFFVSIESPKPTEIIAVFHSVLSHFQDVVIEELTNPWPGEVTSSAQALTVPVPGVVPTKDGYRLFYGPADAPVLELRPVTPRELARG